ncbi:hypothetical protein QQF64_011934 [Cirrhinus molitorella]|uniref:Uncharacterized protein n=1 Tax=Cirrhinus molitorella TaxID=172907 RepID=A0ABR3LX86_9TELE
MSHPRVTREGLFPVRLTLFTSLTPFPPPEDSFKEPAAGLQSGKPLMHDSGPVRERVVPGEVGQDSQVYRAMLFFSGICFEGPLHSPKPPPDVSDSLNSTFTPPWSNTVSDCGQQRPSNTPCSQTPRLLRTNKALQNEFRHMCPNQGVWRSRWSNICGAVSLGKELGSESKRAEISCER